MSRRRSVIAASFCAAALFIGATTVAAAATTGSRLTPRIKTGGSATVLMVNEAWFDLNPATNTLDALDAPINDAIFGGLFQQSPTGIQPDLAQSYSFSDDSRILNITVRSGVKFQDGTPLTGAAVASEINEALAPSSACICASAFAPVQSVTASGNHVIIKLSQPSPSILSAFVDEAPNWPISPTALASEGASTFSQRPVGAGPFEVVSNTASATLQLKRFSGYWQKGEPYLDNLTITSIGTDQSAFAALQAGTAQLVLGVATPSVVRQAQHTSGVSAALAPGIFSDWVQFDANIPPFNSLAAREAVYYATDPASILKSLQDGLGVTSETGSGPASLDYQKTVAGYRGYNLAKANALVQKMGGLSFTFIVDSSPTNDSLADALDTQWSDAGMHVTLDPVTITQYLAAQESHTYEVQLTDLGGSNPTYGIDGLISRVAGTIGGENDPQLTGLINQTMEVASASRLNKLYAEINEVINQKAYGPFLFAAPDPVLSSKSLHDITPLAASTFADVSWPTLWIS